jgi:glucose/mannose-6-phosphate isomerase
MRDIILGIPQQIRTGSALGAAHPIEGSFRRIISCGMGGSAVAGEILSLLRDDVVVHWDYDLPQHTTSADLVICTSWSGTTEETISSYQAARACGAATLVITCGGPLADMARKDASPLIELPAINALPRANIGTMAGALFAALGMADKLPLTLDAAELEQQGTQLAAKLEGRMLSIYASYPWRKLTGIWKMVYSETAKRQVLVNWFPSGAHNEVVGWEGPHQATTSILCLRDPEESARYSKNFDALLAILGAKGYTVHTVALSGNTVIEKVFTSYMLSLWTSYAVAVSLGIDPQTTELLDEFKRVKAQAV